MPHEIVYPQGCRPVTDNLGADELIRRLKTLAHTLQGMGQDEGMYQQYIPLAIHLAEEPFLLHPSRDVQLLIACCIADVLRVYAPDAPYKDPEQVKTIFLFIIKQLGGLRDPKDPAFKRYFYLLENLAYVKSFNMCFELEDCQEIFCTLFTLMFKIVNDEHSSKVKVFMLDVLCPLITESDVVSNKLLDIILMNIVEPYKSQRKNAYNLAKDLVIKCSDTLEPYIQAFFNHVLILGKEEKGISICSKVYSLIYELNNICPSVLSAVLPQLECKLKSNQEQERLEAVGLLARMFSEKDSTLAKNHPPLWRAFLGRFNDISVQIRIKCVQYSMHFLLNHPDLRPDITETLMMRQHDSEENVRYEVVTAIVSTAKRDFEVVSQSEDLLKSVKERTRDKKFKIRKEAMSGLALIYRKHLHENDVPQATKKAVTWMKDKILHGYYMNAMEDRLLVERLLNNSLVPYQLPPDERMKKLYHLWGTIDDHATKAFIELHRHQMYLRKAVSDWVELHKRPVTDEITKDISAKLAAISKYLPEPVKSQEFLAKFSTNLYEDQGLLIGMEAILRPDIPCKECAEIISLILKKLGQPVMTNLYYNTMKMLMERISSVMIDNLALKELINCVEDCLQGGNLIEEIGLHPNTAGEKGLKLLNILSYLFSHHFLHEDIITKLLSFLDYEDENIAPYVLSIFTFLGKYKPLGETFPEIVNQLAPICKRFAETGTPKQAKQAVRCIFINVSKLQDSIFGEVLEKIKENLNSESQYYRTAIVALGHIAYNLPDKYPAHIKNIVSRKIVKELLVKESELSPIGQPHDRDWCTEDNLPDETRSKVDGLKTMARWLLGLKEDTVSAQKTFRMLNAFITHKGDLLQTGKMSKAEMAWLRLTAGCAMLKICEQKGVGDQFSPEQFCQLSCLLLDEVPQVRELFLNKLHKGLNRGVPNKCLPLDFMGFYALTGLWTDKRMKGLARQYMMSDITKRREYAKTLLHGSAGTASQPKLLQQLPNIMPDLMITFAMPVLTHSPNFTSHTDKDQLTEMQTCLTHILEPLISLKDTYCFGFYKELIERMKNHRLATANDDNNINVRMWALCDLAMSVLVSKTVNFELRNFPTEPRIPAMYFKRMDDLAVNKKNYLPPEMQVQKKLVPPMNLIDEQQALAANTRQKRRLKASANQSPEFDVEPAAASETRIQLPGLLEDFFNDILILGKKEKGISIWSEVLIYDLNNICPDTCWAVLPQLVCKLKSNQEQERLKAVEILARILSEKDSAMAKNHPGLWRAFLGRFNDISVQIRIKCVQYSMHFLLNHPDLRPDITETLLMRQHDSEENVRYQVVLAIVSTARRDFEVVSQSEDLLKAVTWMKDEILHGYYMNAMEDRILVERLLNNSLVPYQLPPDERMKKLYHLWGTIDDHATKAFIELHRHQMYLRKAVSDWVELHKRPVTDEITKDISAKLAAISKYLPEPVKSQEFLAKFSTNLYEDQGLLIGMEAILRPDIPCKECADIISLILKKLGQPVMTNLYYNTMKMLMERISSVMIDNLALKELINCVEDCGQGGNLIEEIGLHPNTAGEKGLKLLVILSYLFSCHFLHEDIITKLLSFLDYEDENIAPYVLSIFTFIGKYKPLGETFPEIVNQLATICKRFAETGTPKQAKQAVRCIFINVLKLQDSIFGEVLEKIKENLNSESLYYRTAIVALGHIAYNLPDKYPAHIKKIVSRKIVKELLVKESELSPIGQPHDRDWCTEDNLPDETRSKVDGLKTMARWLLGLKEDTVSAQNTFQMLNAFITNKGDLFETGKMSKAEMAWLRLTAGCAMLKICEQKGVGDQFSPEQFCQLSCLLLDEVPQVREMFLNKLHKGLNRGVPNKCLPLDFMGFYALTGLWTDKRMKGLARQYMMSDITKRREFARTLLHGSAGTFQQKLLQQLPNIMPDFMITFAMPVLTHSPNFTSHTDKDQLTEMQTCLTHILEPLISLKDTYCFGFYKELIERMKNHRLVTANNINKINMRMWALCDLAMSVLVSKTVNFELRNFPTEPRIPAMYFKRMDNLAVNKKNYLPPEMRVQKKLVPMKPMNLIEEQQALAANTCRKRRLKASANQSPEFDVESVENREPAPKRTQNTSKDD